MDDLLPSLLVVLVAAAWLAKDRARYSGVEWSLLWASFGLHVLAAGGQIWVNRSLYGEGDLLGYHAIGTVLAAALRSDFAGFAPETLKIIFHQEGVLPIDLTTADASSAMMVLAGYVMLVVNDSLWAGCILISLLAFHTMRGVYHVVRERMPDVSRPRILTAFMLTPSVVFWSSGLLKESFAISGLAASLAGAYGIWRGRWISGALTLAVGATLVGTVKGYILFPFAAAGAMWVYWVRAIRQSPGGQVRLRPLVAAGGIVMALVGIALLGRLFPEYSVDSFADKAASYQAIGENRASGSSYDIGSSEQRSFAGQMEFAPVALGTALFRPFIFEARNVQSALAALETTTLLWLIISSAYRKSWRGIWRRCMASPELIYCLVFTLMMSVAVGLTTTNLGTLSRYRMPMVPFFALFALTVAAPLPRRRGDDTPERAEPSNLRASLQVNSPSGQRNRVVRGL